jgi:hypothetical protein
MYNENSDDIEFIEEEIIEEDESEKFLVLNDDTISQLTSEDMQLIMDLKDYGKS